jgi:nitrate/TMAO reductase-like tetraheme cytochrome c subunit
MLGIVGITGTAVGWTYTNSSPFCGMTCHTMPPQYATFLRSPHSRVDCVECHIGREDLAVMLPRKIQHSDTLYKMVLHQYEYPIVAEKMRPANEACETCHYPAKFSTDKLREVRAHQDDEQNTPMSVFLLLRTGGGAKREGLGQGIHWHIENDVTFFTDDHLEQDIPYVRVKHDDGTVEEFLDVDATQSVEQYRSQNLKKVDCITCHNRVSHAIPSPELAVDSALYKGTISYDLPFVRKKTVELLTVVYPDEASAFAAFETLDAFYSQTYPDVYASHKDVIHQVIEFMKSTYTQTQFPDQKLDWRSHPENTGHKDSPGCFRCHDGKHLSVAGNSIRLECNLCHSVPETADPSKFVTTVSIVRGAEPGSHTHSAWITLHGKVVDLTCARCHPAKDPKLDWTQLKGKKPESDGSFCGNSACHQPVWKFAGFDSPNLKSILEKQLEVIKQMNQ